MRWSRSEFSNLILRHFAGCVLQPHPPHVDHLLSHQLAQVCTAHQHTHEPLQLFPSPAPRLSFKKRSGSARPAQRPDHRALEWAFTPHDPSVSSPHTASPTPHRDSRCGSRQPARHWRHTRDNPVHHYHLVAPRFTAHSHSRPHRNANGGIATSRPEPRFHP